jgi:outer membrane protein assembly factor BamB
LYCRYGLTLSSVPVGWTDVKLSSKINNMVFDSTNKLLYISCDNGVYKVDARSGGIIWFYPTESPVVQQVYIWKTLIGSPYIYFTTTDGLLYSIHKDTKELQSGYPILLDSVPTSNIEFDFINNTIIIGDYSSKVNMFKE